MLSALEEFREKCLWLLKIISLAILAESLAFTPDEPG